MVETCKGLHGLTSNKQHLHVAVVTWLSLQPKLKMDKNGHAFKVAQDALPCFADMFFIFFWKLELLSVWLTFSFNLKIDY